eukprot:8769247-Alexandrium_andersonii.AAC.1
MLEQAMPQHLETHRDTVACFTELQTQSYVSSHHHHTICSHRYFGWAGPPPEAAPEHLGFGTLA